MREQEIKAHWKRALKALRAAEALKSLGLPEDAVARGYYAAMYASQAALLVQDVVADSHAAVQRLFGQFLVRTGEIEKEWAKVLARAHDQRGNADYVVGIEMPDEAVESLVRDARSFVERMAEYLTSKGLKLEGGQATASAVP